MLLELLKLHQFHSRCTPVDTRVGVFSNAVFPPSPHPLWARPSEVSCLGWPSRLHPFPLHAFAPFPPRDVSPTVLASSAAPLQKRMAEQGRWQKGLVGVQAGWRNCLQCCCQLLLEKQWREIEIATVGFHYHPSTDTSRCPTHHHSAAASFPPPPPSLPLSWWGRWGDLASSQ